MVIRLPVDRAAVEEGLKYTPCGATAKFIVTIGDLAVLCTKSGVDNPIEFEWLPLKNMTVNLV